MPTAMQMKHQRKNKLLYIRNVPRKKRFMDKNIGFLEASLDAEPLEFDIQVRLRINRPGKKFKISGIVHFDNTERGVRSVEELPTEMIEI